MSANSKQEIFVSHENPEKILRARARQRGSIVTLDSMCDLHFAISPHNFFPLSKAVVAFLASRSLRFVLTIYLVDDESRLLISEARKSDVNTKDADDGTTVLIHASKAGHVEAVRELMKCTTVDVNVKTDEGHTAVSWASYEGHLEVVALLLKSRMMSRKFKSIVGSCMLGMMWCMGRSETKTQW